MGKALRGINLGGWLVAERWMTQDLFRGVQGDDEYSLGWELGKDKASRRLKLHRDTFITQRDFRWIADQGFDFVRLPVGYWLLEGTENFVEGREYLQNAFKWAQQCNLLVVLDLHGLQGSQNGEAHSGRRGRVQFFESSNQQRALSTLEELAKTYGHHPSLLGLQVINEPKAFWLGGLIAYYRAAYNRVKPHLAAGVNVIVSDAFHPRRMSRALVAAGLASKVVMDVHLYQTELQWFVSRSFVGHEWYVRRDWGNLLRSISRQVPVMVGEWSAAMPTKNMSTSLPRRQYATYYKTQQQVFDTWSWAHAYWTYKAPHNGPWEHVSRPDQG